MNTEDLIALNEEIAGMARAGLPLDQGLASMAREMGRGRLQKVTAAIAEDLREGHTLPEALERQAGQVPPSYAALVTAGVRTGRIGEVLGTMTMYARSLANLRSIVVDAMFYPAVVLGFALVLFSVLGFFILPQFDKIFKDFGMQLPVVTELTLQLGRHSLEFLWLPIGVIVLAVILVRLSLRFTKKGPRIWAHLVYTIPVVGTMVRSARLAAFADLLGILVDYGFPLPEAFRLAGEASSDPIMADRAKHVQQDLSQGMPLGEVLRGRGLVPEWVSWMTGLGEHRGTLGQALHQVAGMYRRQVEMRATLLRNILPPFVVIGTAGLLVGFFVFAMMLPMIKLMEGLSK